MHREFDVYLLNEAGIDAASTVSCRFDALLSDLEPLLPFGSRETSIVRTKLEEACFFAKKAVALNKAFQK